MRATRLSLACVLALLACGDDPHRRVPSLADYDMPAPRPLDVAAAVPLDDAAFSVDAYDVRYAYRDAQLRIAELRLRELRLGGGQRGATLPPVRFTLDAPGRPRVEGTLAGRAQADAAGRLRFDAEIDVGRSSVVAFGVAHDGAWSATVRLDPLAFADANALLPALPAHGRARGTVALSGGSDRMRVRFRDLALTGDSSRMTIAGAVSRSPAGWSFDDVRVELDPVHPADWRAWLGGDPPVDAPLRGFIVADGDGRTGIDATGSIVALAADGSRLHADVDGRLWLEPRPRLDLALESRSLQLAGRGPLDVDARFIGHADSLAIVARARLSDSDDALHPLLRELPAALIERFATATLDVDARVTREGDARRATGTARIVDDAGRDLVVLRGTAPVDGDGVIDLSARIDSLPLTLLPLPAQLEDFRGYAVASARATGSVATPALEARVDLHGVRFDVPQYGTGVDSLTAGIRLAGDRIEIVQARAYRGDGALTLSGGARLGSPLDLRDPARAFEGARLDVLATLDTMVVVDMDSARVVVAGRLRASGSLTRPHVEGVVAIVDGFAYEGKLAPNPPLDPADPPYSDLLATAPWPATALRAAARADLRADTGAQVPPLTADVSATITPAFRVIDEDSDLGARGAVRVVVDERGVTASGDAAIVDGFYAYYGELFRLTGGAFAVGDAGTELAMSGILRDDYRPLGLGQGGASGFDRRDPPIGIFGYSTPATVLELLRRRAPFPATQPELAALLLFDVPLQPVDGWHHELVRRSDDAGELVGHRSAVQGAGLAWSYAADELYDYVPLEQGYLRAGTLHVGSRYPGWIMVGTQLEAGVNLADRLTVRATHVVDAGALPGVGLRYALRPVATAPADRHVELFNEPRYAASFGTRRDALDVRRRTGLRLRWRWDW